MICDLTADDFVSRNVCVVPPNVVGTLARKMVVQEEACCWEENLYFITLAEDRKENWQTTVRMCLTKRLTKRRKGNVIVGCVLSAGVCCQW